MSKNSRVFGLLAVAALAVCAVAAGSAGAHGTPAASASKTCAINYTGYGHNMYLTSLKVRHSSCAKGKAVVRGYTACRYKRGGLNGHCGGRIKGFKCHEGSRTVAPHIQYSVAVTCKHRAKRVLFSYTQQV